MSLSHGVDTMMADMSSALQSQKAVSAYFTSEQILPFGFAEQNRAARMGCLRHTPGGVTVLFL